MSPATAHLIRIEGEVRRCATRNALWQHLANEPVALLPFGQALVFEARQPLPDFKLSLFKRKKKAQAPSVRWIVAAVSGLARVNRDVPMLRWYEHLVAILWRQAEAARKVRAFSPPSFADPADPCTDEAALRHLLWVPLADGEQPIAAGWLLARDSAWEESHKKLAQRLALAYAHGASAIAGRSKPQTAWRRHTRKIATSSAIAALVLAFVPVPLTTLAPVEVTPQDPFVVAAPVAGVVERVLVAPGAQVKVGTPLVQLVDITLRSDSARLDKSIIRARQGGVALYGDPQDWVGRRVAVGEAIMHVVNPRKVEFQVKVPVSDAVNLGDGAELRVFLDAAPLDPIDAKVVHAADKAEVDAAGVASFTVIGRASNASAPAQPLGLRGTARVHGKPVSLFYYLMCRSLAALRQWTGL